MVLHLIPLYTIYFFILPLIFIFIYWTIFKEESYLDFIEGVRWTHEDIRHRTLRKSVDKIHRLGAFFVIFLILFLPAWSFITSEICDGSMHRELAGGSFGALSPVIKDPVIRQLGPSYNINEIKQQMREKPNVWLPDEVEKYIDIDELTALPGRMAVYRMFGDRYVITYTYLAPYPIIKAYGFFIGRSGGNYYLLPLDEKTIIYPMSPGDAGTVSQ